MECNIRFYQTDHDQHLDIVLQVIILLIVERLDLTRAPFERPLALTLHGILFNEMLDVDKQQHMRRRAAHSSQIVSNLCVCVICEMASLAAYLIIFVIIIILENYTLIAHCLGHSFFNDNNTNYPTVTLLSLSASSSSSSLSICFSFYSM